ncbi:uncharacterized protein LOC135491482 [Lineus longissimus]|uniref:uncharacterized protein LOC135491482 n=1 Tax=Lineus longissimus TaxID=88925 RepID=UPI002B4E6E54
MAGKQVVPVISKEITIDGELYSLEIVPKASTQLVVKQRNALSADLDLPGLVEDLQKLGSFVRVAFYGVTGHTQLQIKVQKLGFTVAKLCQESDITVVLFKKACTEVIDTLQSTYEYLLDGFEDIAVDNLKALAEVAKKMADASDKLTNEFKTATGMVEATLEDTMTEKGNQENEKKKAQDKQKEEETKAEQEKIKQKGAEEAEACKRAEYSSSARREDQAESNLNEAMRVNRDRSFFDRIFRSMNGEICQKRDILKEAREERLKTLREIDRQREEKLKATLELKNCVLRMQQAKAGESLSEAAINALHGAQSALKAITVIMIQASKFWRLMHEHCKQMGNEQMVDKIEKQMNKPEAIRLKLWGSKPFIKEGVQCYAKWVALEDVCTTYRDQIRGVEGQLYTYLKENPTTEEARQEVPAMAMALKDDLEKAIAKMNKEAIEDKKEMNKASKETEEEKETD